MIDIILTDSIRKYIYGIIGTGYNIVLESPFYITINNDKTCVTIDVRNYNDIYSLTYAVTSLFFHEKMKTGASCDFLKLNKAVKTECKKYHIDTVKFLISTPMSYASFEASDIMVRVYFPSDYIGMSEDNLADYLVTNANMQLQQELFRRKYYIEGSKDNEATDTDFN